MAHIEQTKLIDVTDLEKQGVFVVYRISDMTEGKGHMVLDSIWENYCDAVVYMDSKPGVMGRKENWSTEQFGDWKIKFHQFSETTSFEITVD